MANQLATARSAYLRSASHQPVAWQPWGAEPFERAAREGKPVLLDIGAAWCHWCHVMDAESYDDPEVAEFLNRHFVAIKVDRDERPDVDARYQRAVQALTRQGGWPLTAFLNARGEVFFGGTYFPPGGAGGRPGFLSVLRRVAHVYRAEPERVAVQAAELRDFVARLLDESGRGTADGVVLDAAVERVIAAADLECGGFGLEPKFPHPAAVSLLLDRWHSAGEGRARDAAVATLDGMARGGFRDQLGGGFHRYGTDRRWLVPHFEKMASDNAELLRCYVKACRVLGRASDREVVVDTLGWIRDTLADPDGGYGASQDADLGSGDDGAYFTWSAAELAAALPAADLELANARFGFGTDARMPHDPSRSVPFLAASVAEVARRVGSPEPEVARRLEGVVQGLRAARRERPAPFVDRTRYAGWTAMMAAAVLDAGVLLDDRWALDHGIRSLDRLRREHPDGARIRHGPGAQISGLLEDQVQTASASLDAFELTGQAGWLDWSLALMAQAVADLWDEAQGGFFDRPADPDGIGLLAERVKSIQDSPNAAPNALAGIVLARLHQLTGQPVWRDLHRRLIDAFADRAEPFGVHGATYLTAVSWGVEPVTHLVVIGPPEDVRWIELHRVALNAPGPRRVVIGLAPGTALPGSLPGALKTMVDAVDRPAGFLCRDGRCAAPEADPVAWRALLADPG